MNTTTFDTTYTTGVTESGKTGFFKRLMLAFIAAREAEARRRVAIHISSLSDHQLAGLGMGARDIELARSGPAVRVELAG